MSVLALENTHNTSGGTVWPLGELRETVAAARELGLRTHLDGARLMNAAVASGVPAAEIASGFDTATLCLSKGLGCPLGALIAGSHELMHRARIEKHRFGGAMRQAGIVAAAGVYALDHNVDRLADDHARARRLGEAWAEAGLSVDLELVQTNFVQLDVASLGLTVEDALDADPRAGRIAVADAAGCAACGHLARDRRRGDRARAHRRAARRWRRSVSEKLEQLDRLVQEQQADRLPSVSASVVRKGEIVWTKAVGGADYEGGLEATPGTQYRIGSITKTFTATAIMQLRDLGKLDLDDRLGQHLDDIGDGSPTIRRMLAHISGLKREVGEMFVDLTMPTEDDLVVGFALEPARSASLLEPRVRSPRPCGRGEERPAVRAVRRREGHPPARARADDVAGGRAAGAGLPRRRLRADGLGGAGAGPRRRGGDGAAVVDGRGPRALGDVPRARRRTASSTRRPSRRCGSRRSCTTPTTGCSAWGLGLMLYNQSGTIFGGHGGAMPGHLAGVYMNRKTQVGAAALTNSGSRADMDEFAIKLAAKAMELWPEPIETWRPEEEPPRGRPQAPRRVVLGRTQFVFTWETGITAREGHRFTTRSRRDDVRTGR